MISTSGTSIAQSVAGISQAEKIEARDKAPKQVERGRGRGRLQDELDLSVEGPLTADGVRSLNGNTDEEAHEDRRQHAFYHQHTLTPHQDTGKELDVQG